MLTLSQSPAGGIEIGTLHNQSSMSLEIGDEDYRDQVYAHLVDAVKVFNSPLQFRRMANDLAMQLNELGVEYSFTFTDKAGHEMQQW